MNTITYSDQELDEDIQEELNKPLEEVFEIVPPKERPLPKISRWEKLYSNESNSIFLTFPFWYFTWPGKLYRYTKYNLLGFRK